MTEKSYSPEEIALIKKIEIAVSTAFRDHMARIKNSAGDAAITAVKSGKESDKAEASRIIEQLSNIEQSRYTAMNAIANSTGVKLTY